IVGCRVLGSQRDGAALIGGVAIGGVGHQMVLERRTDAPADEARIVAFAVIGPVAGIVTEIDVLDRRILDRVGEGRIGHFAGLVGGEAVGGVGIFMAVERAAEAGVVAFAIIGPIARIVAEIDAVDGDVGDFVRGGIGDLAGFIGVAAIGSVGHFVAGQR